MLYKKIILQETYIYIKDLSRNGTFINGELIGQNETRLVKNCDVISIIEANLESKYLLVTKFTL